MVHSIFRGLVLTLLLALLSLTVAYSQPSDDSLLSVLSNQISESFDGFFLDTQGVDFPGLGKVKVIEIGGYHDNQMVIRKMNRLVNDFSDIRYTIQWEQHGNKIASMITLTDEERPDYKLDFVVAYDSELDWIYLTMNSDTD